MKILDLDIRDAFFDEVYKLASQDRDLIFITADADAFSLRKFKKDFPDQFINVGVAEQNLISVAAGLALSGKKVMLYAIIPFITFRCFEHIKVDLCSLKVPVTIIGLGAGLSFGYDGPTHHAIQDLAVMRSLPELMILNPSDSFSAAASAHLAYQSGQPVYIRLDKGKFPQFYGPADDLSPGFKVVKGPCDINIISTGFMTFRAMELAEELARNNLEIGVIDLFKIKPLAVEKLAGLIGNSKKIITLEENSLSGGIGTLVSEIISDRGLLVPLQRIALADRQYFDNGTREWLLQQYGMDIKSLIQKVTAGEADAIRA